MDGPMTREIRDEHFMSKADGRVMSVRQVAIHEAGHAVVALVLGGLVARVWIDGNGGRTIAAQVGRECPLVDAIVACAGSMAEGEEEIDAFDARTIRAQGLSEKRKEAIKGLAKVIVEENRDAIEAVAIQLEKRRTISSLAFKRIVLKARPSLRGMVAECPRDLEERLGLK